MPLQLVILFIHWVQLKSNTSIKGLSFMAHLSWRSNSPFDITHSLPKTHSTTKLLTWDHMSCSNTAAMPERSNASAHLERTTCPSEHGMGSKDDPNFFLGQTSSLLWLTFLCNKELQIMYAWHSFLDRILSWKPLLADINLCLYCYIIFFKMSYNKK